MLELYIGQAQHLIFQAQDFVDHVHIAVAKVIERLSIAFLEDGRITKNEIDAAFAQVVTLKNVKEEDPKKK